MATKKNIPSTKKELIKAINNICGADTLEFDRKVAVHELWTGRRMAKQYACAVSKNKYYIHFASYCSCGGDRYDVGEDMDYPLDDLSTEILTNLYKRVHKEFGK